MIFLVGIHSMQGSTAMELQEKEVQKEQSLKEIYLERIYS